MSNPGQALYHLRRLDDLAEGTSPIHRLNPTAKLMVTLVYLLCVVSFGKYEIQGLLMMAIYPVILLILSEIPVGYFFSRLLLLEPFVIGIGLLNPLFETSTTQFLGVEISLGWISFLSILIKGTLTISAGLLLVATTGIDSVCTGLRMMRFPRILVLQILLTYRYAHVLIEEISRMARAYSLRAPGSKGIHPRAWGSYAGQLLLRTYDRASRIYQAMVLRGYSGALQFGKPQLFRRSDAFYCIAWTTVFLMLMLVPLPEIAQHLLKGVFPS